MCEVSCHLTLLCSAEELNVCNRGLKSIRKLAVVNRTARGTFLKSPVRLKKEPEPYLKDIAGYVNELIKDGDTIQIGVGRATEPLVRLGMFDGKHHRL